MGGAIDAYRGRNRSSRSACAFAGSHSGHATGVKFGAEPSTSRALSREAKDRSPE